MNWITLEEGGYAVRSSQVLGPRPVGVSTVFFAHTDPNAIPKSPAPRIEGRGSLVRQGELGGGDAGHCTKGGIVKDLRIDRRCRRARMPQDTLCCAQVARCA